MTSPTESLRSSFAFQGAICCVVMISIICVPRFVDARPVNISNTWILPEEGFPVFYRYFRDRISWYEADAVCQFHHANLVTVDTTAQYDAARAYLKELDIMSSVWIGLIKSNEEGDFTWTDYKALSGEGYWASAPEGGRTPLCTALDPARDYRWGALSCGGPQIASFICELPVPAWALNPPGGCLLKSLPSLTVQFLPELAGVQLISDCGLDGTKKVTCKANESHTDVLKELSCAISEEDFSDNTVTGVNAVEVSSGSPRPSPGGWTWAPTTPAGDLSTRPRRETTPPSTSMPVSTTTAMPYSSTSQQSKTSPPVTKPLVLSESAPSTTKSTKINQSTTQSKMLEDSAVSENPKQATVTTTLLESSSLKTNIATTPITISPITDKVITTPPHTRDIQIVPKSKEKEHQDIFTQATDHFIPPLVMAKSKLSADMTVVSPEIKHQQYIAHHLHQLHKSTGQSDITNTKSVINNTDSNSKFVELKTTDKTLVTEKVTASVTLKSPIIVQINSNTPTTPKEETVSNLTTQSQIEAANTPDQFIDDKSKYRKPSKGKKYDKVKEEKKKSKTSTEVLTTESVHKVVQVTIPNMVGSNTPTTILDITTKLPDKISTMQQTTPKTVFTTTTPLTTSSHLMNTTDIEETKILIDPNLMKLNKEGNVNNESEIVQQIIVEIPITIEKEKINQTESNPTNFANKKNSTSINHSSDLNPQVITKEKDTNSSEEILEQNMEPIPRPNRSRTLTQTPQHRSFYPYFFNRVLG